MIKVGSKANQSAEISVIDWHMKEERYYYLLTIKGKKISRRYFEDELEKLSAEVA